MIDTYPIGAIFPITKDTIDVENWRIRKKIHTFFVVVFFSFIYLFVYLSADAEAWELGGFKH